MTNVLEISEISHAYAGVDVLRAQFGAHDARATLAAGETAILSGPSGAGKSTLLTLIAGLLLPTAGAIRIAGQSWAELSESARDRHRAQHIGYLPQREHLLATLNVFDNILLPHYFLYGSVSPSARERVQQLANTLGFAHRMQAKITALSQGEAQRVCLARAVMNSPQLVLVDEPTANLDDASVARVLTLLAQTVRQTGAALVIATHDQRVHAQSPGAKSWTLAPC